MAINKNAAWPPYDVVRELNVLKRQVKQLQVNSNGSAWYEYSPVWGGFITAPALGSGKIDGWYQRVASTCKLQVSITMASDTTYGSGNWTFSLPFPAKMFTNGNVYIAAGSAFAYDNSAGLAYSGTTLLELSTQVLTAWCSQAGPGVGTGQPFAWAANDLMLIDASYQVAEGY